MLHQQILLYMHTQVHSTALTVWIHVLPWQARESRSIQQDVEEASREQAILRFLFRSQ